VEFVAKRLLKAPRIFTNDALEVNGAGRHGYPRLAVPYLFQRSSCFDNPGAQCAVVMQSRGDHQESKSIISPEIFPQSIVRYPMVTGR
jgi:hypothetical protein